MTMRILCLCIGKTEAGWTRDGVEMYRKRVERYLGFDWLELPDVRIKYREPGHLKTAEGEAFLAKIQEGDFVILLDEGGEMLTSRGLAERFERWFHQAPKRIVFIIGGAFGFSDAVQARANTRLSLSKMTFSHQMVRIIFLEQVYRAMTILRSEPYHND